METKQTRRRAFDIQFKLDVIKFAEETSGEAAARKFDIDPKCVREWRKKKTEFLQITSECTGDFSQKPRRRLKGAGSKPLNSELDAAVFDWILTEREKGLRVSRRMIREKAKELLSNVNTRPTSNGKQENFKASTSWLRRFMKKRGLSLRTISPQDPNHLFEKIVALIMLISKKDRYDHSNIVAMDETYLWFDTITDELTGQKSMALQFSSTGNKQTHAIIVLAARGDGTKFQPYVVFKKGVEMIELQVVPDAVVTSSETGLMNDFLTADWLIKIFQNFSFSRCLLVWDSYRCHISESIKQYLQHFNTEMIVVPEECAKYMQVADVCWNEPFKTYMVEQCKQWLARDVKKEFVEDGGGGMKPPTPSLIVEWVKSAWDSISVELIRESFKGCALTTAEDGSEDDQIQCLREGKPCFGAKEILKEARENREVEMIFAEDEGKRKNRELLFIDESDNSDKSDTEIIIGT